MILRIRTNLTTIKIDLPPTFTLEDLRRLICQKLSAEESIDRSLTLSRDIFGRDIVISTGEIDTLEQLNLRHGDELHLLDRFEYYIIEKDYINDNHELVKAGKKIKVLEYFQDRSTNESVAEAPSSVSNTVTENRTFVADIPSTPAHLDSIIQSLPPPTNIPHTYDASVDNATPPPLIKNAANMFEEIVRSPDEIRRIQLIEPSASGPQRPQLTLEVCY